jgi:hypothetical protein
VATENTETTEDTEFDFSVFSVISVVPTDSFIGCGPAGSGRSLLDGLVRSQEKTLGTGRFPGDNQLGRQPGLKRKSFVPFENFVPSKERILVVIMAYPEMTYDVLFLWTLHTRSGERGGDRGQFAMAKS